MMVMIGTGNIIIKEKVKKCSDDKNIEVLNRVGGAVQKIYAPQSMNEFKLGMSIFKEYAEESIYNKFTSVNPNFKYETFKYKIDWKDKAFGNKKYQEDSRDRLYYCFDITRNNKSYGVKLEFILNDNGKIADYRVYR